MVESQVPPLRQVLLGHAHKRLVARWLRARADFQGDEELFSLAATRRRQRAGMLDAVGEEDGHEPTDDEATGDGDVEDEDSDEEAAYQGRVEAYLDAMYERYQEARGAASGQGERRRKRRLADAEDGEGLDGDAHMPAPMPGYGEGMETDSDEGESGDEDEGGAAAADKKRRRMEQWYSQDLFAGVPAHAAAGARPAAQDSDEEDGSEDDLGTGSGESPIVALVSMLS